MSEKTAIGYKNSIDHLDALIKARVPFAWCKTYEESRFINDVYDRLAQPKNMKLFTWSTSFGIVEFNPGAKIEPIKGTQQPLAALDFIANHKDSSKSNGYIFILKDFHTVLTPPVPRRLRDLYGQIIKSLDQKVVLIVAPMLAHGPAGNKSGLDPTLEKEISVIDFELPSYENIYEYLEFTLESLKENNKGKKLKSKLDYTKEELQKFAMALQGLTETEINNTALTCLRHLLRLDVQQLLQEKRQIIERGGILEYIGTRPDMSDVGGLDSAKGYFITYSNQFSDEAKAFGVEPLRGVLLTGVPGTGKSLLAKAIASTWSLPLLRLDVGKVMSGLVGGSEEKMRQVISQVEAISPCILWIDEIEKSLSGTKSSNFSDGGTLSRVFGTLLTAMEERMKGVVTIATANDIQALPPELIRRFNEVFFVDLPVASEREEILKIHLAKRKRDIAKLNLNLDKIIELTNMFTGSEIEKAVTESIARAFQTGKKELTSEDLIDAIVATKPIAKVMSEKIEEIRGWARHRARYASSKAEAKFKQDSAGKDRINGITNLE